MRQVFQLLVFIALCHLGDRPARSEDKPWPVLVKEDFEHGMDRWRTTDPKPKDGVWKIVDVGGKQKHALRVTGPSKYEPPYRSPHSIALLKDVKVGDFELTADVQNTNKSAGPHRDLCIFWGYQDPSHFYYVHFGAKADPHACQIFIVNDAPRVMITENGAVYPDRAHDERRVEFIRDHLAAVHDAIDEGVPVIGYCHWSLLDNFEWKLGYAQRFGLVYVDYETQERTVKDSGRFYAGIAQRNEL